VPSALLVFSWDNLSNKGVIHTIPDRVFVWNEVQREEATKLHRVPAAAVVATGAPRFDSFFRMSPSLDRAAFCEMAGLDPARPLVVYLASSPNVSPNEPMFAERWFDALRDGAEPVRSAQVVIRPHPRAKAIWLEHRRFGRGPNHPDGPADEGLALRVGKSVQDDQSLFDVLFHADAVVGLNTSAEIEAGILGKPVYTIRASEVAPGQTGSVHFQYLLESQGGFVHDAATLEQHVEQLGDGLAGRFSAERLQTFVRPRGPDVPASRVLAEEIVAFAADAQSGSALGRMWTEGRRRLGTWWRSVRR